MEFLGCIIIFRYLRGLFNEVRFLIGVNKCCLMINPFVLKFFYESLQLDETKSIFYVCKGLLFRVVAN